MNDLQKARGDAELWLPHGAGMGSVVYDKEGTPYVAVENLLTGANIFRMEKTTKEDAEKRILHGASAFLSN